MSFYIIKLHEEMSYRVSPHVTSNFSEQTSHRTCRIHLVSSCVTGIIVHFKRLGSRCFYDLIKRCYFFFLNRYAYSKAKPRDIRVKFFQNFLRRISKSFLIKLMSQWDFIMGKRLRLCHYHAVTQIQSTGKHQGLEQPVIMSNLQGVSPKKAYR